MVQNWKQFTCRVTVAHTMISNLLVVKNTDYLFISGQNILGFYLKILIKSSTEYRALKNRKNNPVVC